MKKVLISDDKVFIGEELELNKFQDAIISGVIQGIKPFLHPIGSLQTESEWVDDSEAKKILGYRSKSKMQELRNAGAIDFSHYGRKIKYLLKSLIDFLEKNKRSNPTDYEKI